MERKLAEGDAIWRARPSISTYVALYGILTLLAIAVLDGIEFWGSRQGGVLSVFGSSLTLGGVSIPYVAEVVTAVLLLIWFGVRAIGLLLFKARNRYELRRDGLYIDRGIANLQNTFLSAMAFSDARLIRSIGMRLVGRSMIIVEANDGRRFELRMIKNGATVQSLIRDNLAHPTVRIEGRTEQG